VRQRQQVEESDRAHARDLQLLETIQKHVISGVAYLDENFVFVYCNDQYVEAAGHPREALIGHNFLEVFPDQDLRAKFERVRSSGEPGTFVEMPFEFPDQPARGITYWDWTLVPLPIVKGGFAGFVLSVLEVSDKVKHQQQLMAVEHKRAKLAEDLNREIAHRMKNNLAMMASLLQLQIAKQPDAQVAAVLEDAMGRLQTFASIHEQLKVTGEENVDLLSAIRSIAHANRKAFAQHHINVSVEGEAMPLPHQAGTHLAVIANELITNAVKHGALGADGKAHVHIGVDRADGTVRLSVWNSGNPLAADFDASKQKNVGLLLVWNLTVEQYGGTFSLHPHDGGTMAEVILDEKKLQ